MAPILSWSFEFAFSRSLSNRPEERYSRADPSNASAFAGLDECAGEGADRPGPESLRHKSDHIVFLGLYLYIGGHERFQLQYLR
jgi:hypothetical protein